MSDNNTTGTNGAKAFSAVMTVLALLGGMAAIMQPMNNRLEAVERALAEHVSKLDHPVPGIQWRTGSTSGPTYSHVVVQGLR